MCRILSPFSSLAETYADDTEEGSTAEKNPQAAITTVEKISTDVLFVRFLQEEWLERSRRLLHQSVDDLVQVGARNLEEKIKPPYWWSSKEAIHSTNTLTGFSTSMT